MADDVLQVAIYKLTASDQEAVTAKVEAVGYIAQELEIGELNGFRLKLHYRSRQESPSGRTSLVKSPRRANPFCPLTRATQSISFLHYFTRKRAYFMRLPGDSAIHQFKSSQTMT